MEQTTSIKKLSITDINRAIKILKEDRVRAVEIKFSKIPNEFEKMALAGNIGVSSVYGIPLIIDKKVPKDECWIKDSNGITNKVKLCEEHLPVNGRMIYGLKVEVKPINTREGVV